MNLQSVTTFGPVLCPSCDSEDIAIVTKATHTSDAVYHGDSGYVAYNSDQSWATEEGTETFWCNNCLHIWPVDKNIWWEWDD